MSSLKIKRNKKEKYNTEQIEIFNKLNNAINTVRIEDGVLLCDILYSNDIIQNIKKLIPYIRCYYSCSGWNFFVNQELDKIELDEHNLKSLIKSIYKYHGYDIILKTKTATRNNIKKPYLQIIFIKNKI